MRVHAPALAIVLLSLVVAAAAAQRPPLRGDCSRAGRTVARNHEVRVLRLAPRTPLVACRLPHGPLRDISDATVRPGNPLGGVHIAYETSRYASTCFHDSSTAVVAVTGKDPANIAHEWDYENDLAPDNLVLSTPSTRRLYVTKRGSAVWSVRSAIVAVCSTDSTSLPVSTWILAIDGRTGKHLTLAHDARIDSTSLRLRGGRASWRRGARRHGAVLP